MLTLVAWTVLSIGFGALVASENSKPVPATLEFIGAASLLWAIGVGLWEVVSWIA